MFTWVLGSDLIDLSVSYVYMGIGSELIDLPVSYVYMGIGISAIV